MGTNTHGQIYRVTIRQSQTVNNHLPTHQQIGNTMIQPKATSDSPTNLGNYFSPKNKLDTPNVTLGINASQNKKENTLQMPSNKKQRIRHVRKDYNRTTHIVDIDYNHQAESTPLPREDKILQHPQPRANP